MAQRMLQQLLGAWVCKTCTSVCLTLGFRLCNMPLTAQQLNSAAINSTAVGVIR
jgi:hypothetical protein